MPIRNILYLLIQILNIAPAHEHLGGVFVVVVADLHHAVALAVFESTTAETLTDGVDGFLQGDVQAGGSHHAALHGGEHLNVVGADVVCLWDAVAHDVDNLSGCLLGVFFCNEEEVGVTAIADVGE